MNPTSPTVTPLCSRLTPSSSSSMLLAIPEPPSPIHYWVEMTLHQTVDLKFLGRLRSLSLLSVSFTTFALVSLNPILYAVHLSIWTSTLASLARPGYPLMFVTAMWLADWLTS